MVQEFDEVRIADGRRRLCSFVRSLRRMSSAAMQRAALTVSFSQDQVSRVFVYTARLISRNCCTLPAEVVKGSETKAQSTAPM